MQKALLISLPLLALGCGDSSSGPGATAAGQDAAAPQDAAGNDGAEVDAMPDVSPDALPDAAAEGGNTQDAADDASDGSSPPLDDGVPEVSCDTVVADESELNAALAAVAPGDTICLAAGDWQDVMIEVQANGQQGEPITVAAEVAGQTFMTGSSGARLGGQHIVLTGLVFRDGNSTGGHLIEFRADEECHNCRLSNVAVLELVDTGDSKWVSLHGEDNRVDHCAFVGKENEGALLVVWRPDAGPDRHRIDHNYFGERPDLGANGGETIRVGTSDQNDSSSFTVVEQNFFFKSDGEIEIVSNKSGDNIYRRNVFEQCAGTLTLRHGQRATVEQNVFRTGGVDGGGGIRVVDAGHRIMNNYIEGCRTGSNVRGGIVLMLADASPAMNGYQQVEDVLIAHNTIVDCEQSLLFGGGSGTEAPRDVTIINNLIDTRDASVPVVREIAPVVSPVFDGNLIWGGELGIGGNPTGFLRDDPGLIPGAGGLERPGTGSPAIGAGSAGSGVDMDIDGEPRGTPPDIGADEVSASPPVLPVTRDAVGPDYDFESLRL